MMNISLQKIEMYGTEIKDTKVFFRFSEKAIYINKGHLYYECLNYNILKLKHFRLLSSYISLI